MKMTSKKIISPFLSRALSSNGDSSSEDDDVFVNSRLDVISRNCDQIDEHSNYIHSDTGHFLDFKMEQGSIPSLFTPSPKSDENAVIFSVYFCGKNFGEVGLFQPDISILDWLGFRSYIFSSLNLEAFDSYVISYCDEEGDKLPIESEEDYEEALKIAKVKASEEEKLSLYITRIGGGFQNSLRSLVSSSLRRVNSVGGGARIGTALQPLKKDVTTSTSFNSLDKENSNNSIELHSDEISPSYMPLHNTRDLSTPQENYFGDATEVYEKNIYDSPESSSHLPGNIPQGFSSSTYIPTNNSWNAEEAMARRDLDMSVTGVPGWFRDYMKQFKEDLSVEVSSKIDERFEDAVGSISATDVASKLKGLLTGYAFDPQNKELCCCKNSNGPCPKSFQIQPPLGPDHAQDIGLEALGKIEREQLSTPLSVLRLDHRDDSIDGDGTNSQDYFLQKLLKREQEILDFLDNTNEKIKQKIKDSSEYTDSLRSCLTKELAIEERERVLARIEDFRQRQSRTTNDIKMLQQSMEVNNEGTLRLTAQEPITQPKKFFDAKFVKDLSFADGSKLLPKQRFRKRWAVQNTGQTPWDEETVLECQSYHRMKPIHDKVPCPSLMPGQVGEVWTDFQAPVNPGICSTEWRFARNECRFGDHLWCSVIVSFEEESELHPPPDATYFSDYTNYVEPGNYFRDEQPSVDNDIENQQILDDNENPPNDKDPSEKLSPNLVHLETKKKGAFPIHPLRQMNSEQMLWFLLYVFRITKPDFSSVRNTAVYKAVSNIVTKGRSRDFENGSLMIENAFLENCAEVNLTVEELIICYKELFGTDKETEKRIKHLSFRYLHKLFSPPERGFEVSDDEDEDVDVETVDPVNHESTPLYEIRSVDAAKPFSSGAEATAKETQVTHVADEIVPRELERGQTTDSRQGENLDKKYDEEYWDKENDEEDWVKKYDEEEPKVEGNAVVVQDVLRFIESLNQSPYIRAHEHLLKKMNEQRDNMTGSDEEENCRGVPKAQSNLANESVALVKGKKSHLDHEVGNKNDRSFCRLNEDDCEDGVSSSYSEYSQSDSSLESEDEDTSLKVIKGEGDVGTLLRAAQDSERESEEDFNIEKRTYHLENEHEFECDQESKHDGEYDQEHEHEFECDQESEHDGEYDQEHEHEFECDQESEHDGEYDQEHEHAFECDQENEHDGEYDQESEHEFEGDEESEHEFEGDQKSEHEFEGDQESEHESEDNQESEHEFEGDQESEHEIDGDQESEHESEGDQESEHEFEGDHENEHEIEGDQESEHEIESGHESEHEGESSGHESEHEDESDYESDHETGNESGHEAEDESGHESELEDDDSDHESENKDDADDYESDHERENESGHESQSEADVDHEIISEDGIDLETENEEDSSPRKDKVDHEIQKEKDDPQRAIDLEEEEDASHALLDESSACKEQQASCSKEGARKGDLKTSASDLKKDITSLHQNFKQNVQIQLDFELISRRPPPEEHVREMESPSISDPLTFQEKHFTISSRPPPEPVKIPDSDDESFDGLVFIKDTDIPSSVPPTEPCSPSNPQQPHSLLLDDSELSVSCSSFSELDDEDYDDDVEGGKSEPVGPPQNLESSSMGSSFSDYFNFGIFSSAPSNNS